MSDNEETNRGIETEYGADNYVIVIGRQFGSGGRSIGRMLASRLGIDYYDTELLKKAAESEGINPDIFQYHDEKKPSVMKALLQGLYGIPDNFHTVPLSGENMYKVQGKVIRDLCKKGSCVIVGRSADVILRDHPNLLSVFLHAPMKYRIDKIMHRKEAMTREEAEEMARQYDRHRESYYNYFCGDKKWGIASNYHLSIDTSKVSDETVVEIILNTMKANSKSGASPEKGL